MFDFDKKFGFNSARLS